jgi:hypothetical protein
MAAAAAAAAGEASHGGAVAVPVEEPAELEQEREQINEGLLRQEGADEYYDDDDASYLRSHTHPRAHPREPEPEGAVFKALYALEGGDPDSEVDVVHEAPGSEVRERCRWWWLWLWLWGLLALPLHDGRSDQ